MRKIIPTLVIITIISMIIPVFAQAQGQGTIRLEPHGSYYPAPIILSSPGIFNVSVTSGGDPTCDPHILLVMTNSSYYGLTGDVAVNWNGTTPDVITIDGWTMETDNGKKIPDTVPIEPGTGYTVASLKDHLQTDEPIWWNFTSILGGNSLTQEEQQFAVYLPSSDPRMLVYVLGKNGDYDGEEIICPGIEAEFDNRVPPTQPGFVVPELGTLLLAAASFAGLALYVIRKKRQ